MKKILFCLKGCPASGKSSFLKEHIKEVGPYVLSTDDIRKLFPRDIDFSNKKRISNVYNDETFQIFIMCLEKRMQINNCVIIDATHYKNSYINNYKRYAGQYGFEIKVVDFFTNIDLQTLLERNAKRNEEQIVPEPVIRKMYSVIENSKNETKQIYTLITPEEMLKEIKEITELKNEKIKNPINAIKNIQNNEGEIFEIFPEVEEMVGFNQQNKYHSLDLWAHTKDVIEKLPKDIKDDMIYFAALFHDIGKLYTYKLGNDGDLHYYGHGNISVEIVKNKIAFKLLDMGYSEEDIQRLLLYIKTHDERLKSKKKYLEKGFKNDEEIKNMVLLQLADINSHNIIKSLIPIKEEMDQFYKENFS